MGLGFAPRTCGLSPSGRNRLAEAVGPKPSVPSRLAEAALAEAALVEAFWPKPLWPKPSLADAPLAEVYFGRRRRRLPC